MRYLSIVVWLAVALAAAFLVAFGLLNLGGWAECDKGDCGTTGEAVWWTYRALAWPTLALVLLAAGGVVAVLARRFSR
jgi:ABC-type dipeptide/oligopeptide/nickel transport system permease component